MFEFLFFVAAYIGASYVWRFHVANKYPELENTWYGKVLSWPMEKLSKVL